MIEPLADQLNAIGPVLLPAEARVGGVLRGGYVDTKRGTFIFHAPYPVTIPISQTQDMKLFDEEAEGIE